ncbi:MAG: protein translocase subunit SecD, partial [Wolbachia pipientis]|nr:protein translocase subunit SecD [Wolbachia pipientis]
LSNFIDNKFFFSKKRINLGLDLKGGSSLLLNVDLDSYFQEKLSILADEIKESLLAKNIDSSVQSNKQIVITLTKVDDYKKILVLVHRINPNLEINKKDTSIFISYKPHYKNSLINGVILESIINVQRRLDKLGTKEVSVQKQGQDKILVQVPGIEDVEQIKSLLGKTARLAFHFVNINVVKMMKDIDHETTVILKDTFGNFYPIFRKVEIGGDSLVNASVRFGHLGKPTVHFKFDNMASKRLAKITKENVGKPFAIVLDNIILTVPIIREPILNGEGEISGHFTEKQASELAILLKSGALPA